MSSIAGIGPAGRSELATVLAGGRRFITPTDVVRALDVDPDAAAKRLARWADDGWLRRARRGLYIPVPLDAENPKTWSADALIVADAVWSPCYFTGWTAAGHWSLTDQVFRSTVLKTAKRVRTASVRVLDHEYLVAHIDPANMSWGVKSLWKEEVRLRVADPSRTVIDIFDVPRLAGGIRHGAEILSAYLDEYDGETLVRYAEKLDNRAVFKRLGYVTQALGHDPNLVAACKERISSGISALDPAGPEGGRRTMQWNLRINVRIETEEPA